MHKPDPDEHEEVNAPEALVEALRQYADSGVDVPAEVDETILNSARTSLQAVSISAPPYEGINQQTRRILPFPGTLLRYAAAAAVVLCVMCLLWTQFGRHRTANTIAVEQPTIIDAFRLARQIDSGEVLAVRYDINGDGQVDDRDVALLAQRAVELPEGGSL